jgi:hypothetical protein
MRVTRVARLRSSAPALAIVLPMALAAIVLAALPGCRGVPVSTMWRLRSFSGADLAGLDAEDVRAAIQLPDDLAPAVGATRLSISVTRGDATDVHVVTLRELSSGRSVPGIAAEAKAGRSWRLFEPDEPGLQAFRALQASFRNEPQSRGEVVFEVSTGFDRPPAPRTGVPIEIRLRLDADEAFFTLFDGTIDLDDRAGEPE